MALETLGPLHRPVRRHGSEASATIARLKQYGVAFRENLIPDIQLRQVFVRDPNGIMVEMNFHN